MEIWKQIIGVQMHFNDLCIRTRWLGSTIITTILGADLYSLDRGSLRLQHKFYDYAINYDLSSLFALFAVIVWLGMKEFDQKYYYKMLLAAVEFGAMFEARGMSYFMISGKMLNQSISDYVPVYRANKTISRFYRWSMIVIIIVLLIDLLAPIVNLGSGAD